MALLVASSSSGIVGFNASAGQSDKISRPLFEEDSKDELTLGKRCPASSSSIVGPADEAIKLRIDIVSFDVSFRALT